jgi:hypothetical protein
MTLIIMTLIITTLIIMTLIIKNGGADIRISGPSSKRTFVY